MFINPRIYGLIRSGTDAADSLFGPAAIAIDFSLYLARIEGDRISPYDALSVTRAAGLAFVDRAGEAAQAPADVVTITHSSGGAALGAIIDAQTTARLAFDGLLDLTLTYTDGTIVTLPGHTSQVPLPTSSKTLRRIVGRRFGSGFYGPQTLAAPALSLGALGVGSTPDTINGGRP